MSRRGGPATTAPGGGRSTVIRSGVNLKGGRITIGVHFSTDLTAVFSAFGSSTTPTDARPGVIALIDWINKNGGIGGKSVDAVLHETNPTNGSFDSQAQLACTDFTEDHKVSFVVSGAIMPSFGLVDCLAKRNVPIVWEYQYLLDQATFDKYPSHLYQPFAIVGDRLKVYVDGLFAQGFFAKGAKIGLLRYDTPLHKKFADGIVKPRLAAHNLRLAAEIAVRAPASAAGAGDTAGQLSNAVLRLRSAGVDHLLFAPSGAAMPFVFGPIAESQGIAPSTGSTASTSRSSCPRTSRPRSCATPWPSGGTRRPTCTPPISPTSRPRPRRCASRSPRTTPTSPSATATGCSS